MTYINNQPTFVSYADLKPRIIHFLEVYEEQRKLKILLNKVEIAVGVRKNKILKFIELYKENILFLQEKLRTQRIKEN